VLSQYVISEEVLSWEEVIRKMTSLPAEKFGLAGRGRLKKDYFADVVILDRDKLASPATKDNPYQYSRGVDYLLVNGNMTVKEGEYQGVRKGRIIKR
jgi:N-acyl-D-amino-acid deacylase